MRKKLYEHIGVSKGLTAFVGGGGKSTLLELLGGELKEEGRVILCTSTHFGKPKGFPFLVDPTLEVVEKNLKEHQAIAIGHFHHTEGKYSKVNLSFEELVSLSDYVLCEADGAKRMPLKAPAEHEPVIPSCSKLVVAVAGLDGIGKAIKDTVHRPEIYGKIVGKNLEKAVTPEDVAKVLGSVEGQKKQVFCPYVVVLNKADKEKDLANGKKVAEKLKEKVVITSLHKKTILIESINS